MVLQQAASSGSTTPPRSPGKRAQRRRPLLRAHKYESHMHSRMPGIIQEQEQHDASRSKGSLPCDAQICCMACTQQRT